MFPECLLDVGHLLRYRGVLIEDERGISIPYPVFLLFIRVTARLLFSPPSPSMLASRRYKGTGLEISRAWIGLGHGR